MQTYEHTLRVNAPEDCDNNTKDTLLQLSDSLTNDKLSYAIIFFHEELQRRIDHANRNK